TINENSLNWTIRPNKVGEPAIFEWENPALAGDWLVENKSSTVSDDSMLYMLPDRALSVVRPYGQKVLIISGAISDKAEREDGGVAVPDPEANFLQLLRQELDAQEIKVKPFTNIPKKLLPTQELAIAYSPPLSAIITTTNKDSNNLYAELLLRAVGEKFYSKLFQKPLGDPFYEYVALNGVNGGISSLKEYLDTIKIGGNNVLLADGSGLSRRNLTTPKAIVQLLYNLADNRTFRSSLPIANIDGTRDGTLASRWKLNPISLQAKTGTLTGVSALSGYAKPQYYSEVIFSIVINNSNLRSRELNSYVDAIIARINRLEPCQ
ncbi:MAG: D-alanyl-D-alanine carboxypeptidase/D-alanyl-D-alanine-endopeptidase, partial [Pseudanabaena sp.]